MTPTAATAADPMTAINAARAVDEWPLLAMLTQAIPAVSRVTHHMMMPVEEPQPAASVVGAVDADLEPAAAFAPQPAAEAPAAETNLSPLEQLFRRAERTGTPQAVSPPAFAAAEQHSPPLSAPPPLKVPSRQRASSPMAHPVAATAAVQRPTPAVESAMTIEPHATERQMPDMVPEHLFERIGGR